MPLKLEDIGECMTDALRDQESTALIRLVFVKHFLHLIKHLSCKVYFIRGQYTRKIFDNISPLLILIIRQDSYPQVFFLDSGRVLYSCLRLPFTFVFSLIAITRTPNGYGCQPAYAAYAATFQYRLYGGLKNEKDTDRIVDFGSADRICFLLSN